MSINKEEIKNKIIYRASYRGSKEMDILMTTFVKSLINDLNLNELMELDLLINLDDTSFSVPLLIPEKIVCTRTVLEFFLYIILLCFIIARFFLSIHREYDFINFL